MCVCDVLMCAFVVRVWCVIVFGVCVCVVACVGVVFVIVVCLCVLLVYDWCLFADVVCLCVFVVCSVLSVCV